MKLIDCNNAVSLMTFVTFEIRNWSHIATHLLDVVVLLLLVLLRVRIGMKFGRIVPLVNTHRFAESDIRFDVIISRWRVAVMTSFHVEVLPAGEWHVASAQRLCSSPSQFLVYVYLLSVWPDRTVLLYTLQCVSHCLLSCADHSIGPTCHERWNKNSLEHWNSDVSNEVRQVIRDSAAVTHRSQVSPRSSSKSTYLRC